MSDYPDLIHGAKPGQLIHRPSLSCPATYVLLALNVLAFALMVAIDASSLPPLLPLLERTLTGISTDPELLLRLGASFGPYTRRGEYWRLVIPMFLHIGLIHLALNNYALYVLGRFMEPIYGYGRFAFLYVATGMASAYLSMTVTNNVSAGASGAIFGIAGVMLMAGILHRGSIPRQWTKVFGTGIVLVIVSSLAIGIPLHKFVDNWCHLGGLVSGIILGVLIPPPNREYVPGQPMKEHSQVLVVIPAAIVAVAVAGAVLHYRADTELTRLLNQAQLFHSLKRDDWAMQPLKAAAARHPRDERPHEAMGQIYANQKKWTDAAREYGLAVSLNSTSVEARLGLAQASLALGNSAQARELLAEIVKEFPKTADAQYELASLLTQYGFYAQAIEHHLEALRRNPDLAVAQNDLAWLYATCDDPKFRDPKAALEHAQRAVALTHESQPNILDTLAEAFYANQQYTEAVNTQAKTLKLDPRNRTFIEHMARYTQAAQAQSGKKK